LLEGFFWGQPTEGEMIQINRQIFFQDKLKKVRPHRDHILSSVSAGADPGEDAAADQPSLVDGG
jgi:hypothetical protein